MIKIFDGKKESAYLMRKTADINISGKCAGAGEGNSPDDGADSQVDWNDVQNRPFGITELKCTFTEADYESAYKFYCGDTCFYCLFEGDYYNSDIVGSSYTETFHPDEDYDGTYEPLKTNTHVIEIVSELVDDHFKRDDNFDSGGIYIFENGSSIAVDDAATYFEPEKPGIYYRCNNQDDRVNEFTLLAKKSIDEAYLPKTRKLVTLTIDGELILTCEDGCSYHKLKVDCDGNLTTEPYEVEE